MRALMRDGMRGWIGRLLLTAILACTTACAPFYPYKPKPSPRIQLVGRALYKDGQEYTLDHIDQLVRGNAEAEREARTYRRKRDGGLAFVVLGILTGVAGGGITIGGIAAKSTTADITGLALMVAGSTLDFWGIALVNDARDHITNAANLYNDALPAAATPLPVAPVR